MASGYGLSGGPGRCFPFWQEVLACYVVNADNENRGGIKQCRPPLEDYMECLHHTKEANKIRNLQRAYRKKEAETPRDNAPSAGQIRSLGLLDRKDEEVDIKKPAALPALADNRGRPRGQKPTVN